MGRRGPKPGSSRSGGAAAGRLGGRPLTPAAALRKAEQLAASLRLRPKQLRGWTSGEIAAVLSALRRAAYALENEGERRAEEAIEE